MWLGGVSPRDQYQQYPGRCPVYPYQDTHPYSSWFPSDHSLQSLWYWVCSPKGYGAFPQGDIRGNAAIPLPVQLTLIRNACYPVSPPPRPTYRCTSEYSLAPARSVYPRVQQGSWSSEEYPKGGHLYRYGLLGVSLPYRCMYPTGDKTQDPPRTSTGIPLVPYRVWTSSCQ